MLERSTELAVIYDHAENCIYIKKKKSDQGGVSEEIWGDGVTGVFSEPRACKQLPADGAYGRRSKDFQVQSGNIMNVAGSRILIKVRPAVSLHKVHIWTEKSFVVTTWKKGFSGQCALSVWVLSVARWLYDKEKKKKDKKKRQNTGTENTPDFPNKRYWEVIDVSSASKATQHDANER